MKNYYFIALLFLSAISQAQIVNIPDAIFKNALVNTNCVDTDDDGNGDIDADTNNDGEIQESEAEAVLGLYVGGKNISSLEGIQSFINLEVLFCDNNQLSSLDVSQNFNLIGLQCHSNQLTSLDASQTLNLLWLHCSDNQLTSLDISQTPNLGFLYCYFNQLTSLDVMQNQNLELLWCWGNQLSSLDVSHNLNLEVLLCSNNQLGSLNIKNGNNHNMIDMNANDNPSLNCIEVDDETATYPICDEENFSGWCKDDWAEYSENCALGNLDFNQLSFTLYPNPIQDVLTIESQELIDLVRIYTINGILIKETLNRTLSVSELATGLYFAQINIGGNSVTKKFVKY